MRDIKKRGRGKKEDGERFSPKAPFPEDLPPDVKELYEKYANKDTGEDVQEQEPDDVALEPASEPSKKKMPPNVPAGVTSTKDAASEDEVVPVQAKPRFTGSKVPIANVHVSRQDLSNKAQRVTRRSTGSGPPTEPPKRPDRNMPKETGESALQTGAQKGRPLFANVAEEVKASKPAKKLLKQKSTTRKQMRLGTRDRKIVAVLLLVVILAAGLAALLFLPKANLTLTLATAPLLVDHQFDIQGGGAVSGTSVAGRVFEEEIAVEGSSAVTSTKVIGEKAEGVVRIINRTFDEQPIKINSRLVTDEGQLYYMKTDAIVPAAEGANLGVATVPVISDIAGEEANLDSGRLNFAALDESAQSVVYAEVAQPITGGSGDEVTVVEEDDLDAARKEAARLASEQLEAGIALPEGYTLLEESREGEVQSFDSDAAVGDEVEVIPFTATVRARVMAYEEVALEKSLREALDEELNDDYMLFPAPLSYTKSVDAIDWDAQKATATARVTHTTIPTFSLETLQDKLAGRSESEATDYLKGLPGVKGVEVDLWPFWVKSIPRIQQRVSIDLEPDRQP